MDRGGSGTAHLLALWHRCVLLEILRSSTKKQQHQETIDSSQQLRVTMCSVRQLCETSETETTKKQTSTMIRATWDLHPATHEQTQACFNELEWLRPLRKFTACKDMSDPFAVQRRVFSASCFVLLANVFS